MLEKQASNRITTAEALAALSGRPHTVSRALQIIGPRSSTPAIVDTAVRSVEPVGTQSRSADIYAVAPATPRVRAKGWKQLLQAENNSNYLVAGMILLAAFVAGLSFVGGAPQKPELPTITSWGNPVVPTQPAPEQTEHVELESKAPNTESKSITPVEQHRQPTVVANPPKQSLKKHSNGQLLIVVKPSDAWITVNGARHQNYWRTDLAAGKYVVQAGKWDCLPAEQWVDVSGGNTSYVTIELKPRPSTTPYEPILCVCDDHAAEVDGLVGHLLNDLWVSDSHSGLLTSVERDLRDGQPLGNDPRALHAVALLALGAPQQCAAGCPLV